MKNRRLIGIFLSIFLTLAFLPLFTVPAEAAGDVAINSTTFPDANFRSYVVNTLNGGSYTLSASKIAAVKIINVNRMNISNLKGIEYFTELTDLDCDGNNLTTLDVRSNTKLQYLYCWNNPSLTTVYLSGCNALLRVDARSTAIRSLDVSGRASLEQLLVSQNSSLQSLSCSSCGDLTGLDLAGCSGLKTLSCENNGIQELDLRYCPNLTHLYCGGNGMTSLDISACPKLETLHCFENQLTSLDLSGKTALVNLYCYQNRLGSLDVSACTNLKVLNCRNNQLSTLDVSQHSALTSLYVNNNPQLTELRCMKCSLTTLNVGNCPKLKLLNCSQNQLTSLVLSTNTALENLYCSRNQLTSLDVGNHRKLQLLYCDTNQLTSLDVSYCTDLLHLYCYQNELSSLNLVNLRSLRHLSCAYNQLTALTPSYHPDLTNLDCGNNQLTVLDVSQNPELTFLDCATNRLTSLNVSKNKKLTFLRCPNNRLTSLDVIQNTQLYYLDCSINSIPSVNITTCPSLVTAFNGTATESDRYWTYRSGDNYLIVDKTTAVSVLKSPVLLKGPSNKTVKAGKDARFTVDVYGSGLQYQWQYSKDGGETWKDCSSTGYDTATLEFKAAVNHDNRLYRCQVSNGFGGLVTNGAKLRVVGIKTQPQAQTVAPGAKAVFQIGASGSPAFQWQYSKDNGSTWTDCSTGNYNKATFSFTAKDSMNGRLYRCVVTKGSIEIKSDAVKLTVGSSSAPAISTQPGNKTVAANKSVTFTVTATGSGLSYQWQYSKDNGKNWTDCTSGAYNTASFSFKATASMNGRLYRCKVSNSSGSVTSNSAKLTISGVKPAITSQPANKTVTAGSTAKFTVTAAGTGLTYQWYYSKDNGATWTKCTSDGSDTASFSFTAKASMTGRLYRCKVTNSSGSVTSSAARLTVK